MQRSFFSALFYGWLAILLMMLLSSLLMAFLIRYSSISEMTVTYIALIIGFLTLLFGGLVAGLKGKANGLLLGLFTGLGFTLMTFLVQYLGFDDVFSLKQLLYHIGYILCAVFGSIIGVNVSSAVK
ncbi:MAG: TIGR04086 family membrane protein [Bacilli bacterium]|nr:TIGR04086 family membrane protein [Bacilli bacterium]